MLDHLAIYAPPEQFDATVAFYEAALQPLGYEKKIEYLDGKIVGFGAGRPDFWVSHGGLGGGEVKVSSAHFAFSADDQATVEKCHAVGLESGGKDNGKPGPRPQYGPNYYAAFLHDPSGNGMEFIYRGPIAE